MVNNVEWFFFLYCKYSEQHEKLNSIAAQLKPQTVDFCQRLIRVPVFVQAAASALAEIGQPVKYGYWDFGTDLSVICGRDKKPAIGYSPMQELYCHRPIDKVRIDYMEKAIAGYTSIFLKMMELPKESFTV